MSTIKAPINNGADICEDALMDNLFDYSSYVEGEKENAHSFMGFINGVPCIVKVVFGTANMIIKPCTSFEIRKFNEHLVKNLNDETIKADIHYYMNTNQYFVTFIYKEVA